MADGTVGVTDLATGAGVKKVDASELTVGGVTVERQRMVIADPVGAGLFANVTAGGALKTDASATTQPVSGTFFQATQPVSLAASVAVTGTFFQATQPVSGTFFQATQPVSLGANQSVNQAQVAGTATDTNSGAKSAGTQRIVIATDQPALTNALKVDPSAVTSPVSLASLPALSTGANVIGAVTQSGAWNIGTVTTLPALPTGANTIGALTANQSVNNAQVAGIATSVNAGVADTGTQRVVLSNEATQDLNITGQAVQTAVNQNIILASAGTTATDCTGYRAISIQINPTGTVSSGVVSFEASNDNTTFTAVALQDEAAPTADPVSTISPATGVSRYMTGPVRWRYFRARISTIIGGGGSVAAVSRLTQVSFSDDQISVTQTTAALLNGTMVLAAGAAAVGTVQIRPGSGNNGASQLRISTGASGAIKATGPGNIYGWSLMNVNAAIRYMQFYAKTTAGVPGADTPVAFVPLAIGGRSDLEFANGLGFPTGISWAITTDAAGVTAGSSGDIVGMVAWF